MHDVAVVHLFNGYGHAVYRILAEWFGESLPSRLLPKKCGQTASFHLLLYHVKTVLVLKNVDTSYHEIARQTPHQPHVVY